MSEHVFIDIGEPGDALVITFGFAQWQHPVDFDFVGRLRKLEGILGQRFHRLYLRDPQLSWYLRGVPGLGVDVATTVAALTQVIAALKPSRVITLGQSMGGYAAVLYGHLLGAERAVAFGALSTMSPISARKLGDKRWLSTMQAPADDGLLSEQSDLALSLSRQPGLEMRMHYGMRPDIDEEGSENLDLFHARRFAALPSTRVDLHPKSGHAVVEHLRVAREIDAVLLQDLFDVDPAIIHRPASPAVDEGWAQWIVENRLLGSSPEQMVEAMIKGGIAPITARSAIAELERDPAFRAAHAFVSVTRKYESVMFNHQRAREIADAERGIERRSHVGRDEFLERYVSASRPLVLTRAMEDWPALRLWSPQYLKHRFAGAEVQVQRGRVSNPRCEQNAEAYPCEMTLSNYVDFVEAGSCKDHYITTSNGDLRRAPLDALLADVGSLPPYCRREGLPDASKFWYGPAGTVTPLHHDTRMLMHMHAVGRKRWRFISPMYTPWLYNAEGVYSRIDLDVPEHPLYPLRSGVKVLETVVEPGDALFIPLGWWHDVLTLDTCMSLSLTAFDFENEFTYSMPISGSGRR
ncbi:cupin-like domain-containing protein [Paucibacter sp. DJ1R-11]|nr:cupin-like domain-containing protein [Paucibacter sp. DJ1R-11]